jgi:hypothetical protein
VQCFTSQLDVEDYESHAKAMAALRAFGLRPPCREAEAFFRVDLQAVREKGALAALPQWPWVRQRLHLANDPAQLPLVSVLVRSMDRDCLPEALASVALASGWTLAAAGLLLAWLELPFEALLPTFVLLEVLTAGLRNVVSVLTVAPLLALLVRDLRPHPPASAEAPMPQVASLYALVLHGRQALALAALLGLALITAWLAGVGVGLRTGQDPQTRHSGSMTWTLKP